MSGTSPNTPDPSSSAATGSSSSSSPLIPQVLTAGALPQLTAGFDASDTLECYLLVRDAYLHGLANSTIPVRKLALGLRYRPRSSYDGSGKRLELTLEYGPSRDGRWLDHEVIPHLVVEPPPSGGGGGGGTRRKAAPEAKSAPGTLASVAWENEARVYYTLRIGGYRTAHYVASMTGAVLKDLLRIAVAYPTQSHRRYQPFSVYYKRPDSAPSPSSEDGSHAAGPAPAPSPERLLLRSSSDLDFVSALWQHLTQVGVELKPVILPPRWRVRLSASSIRRVHAGGMPSSSTSSSPDEVQAAISDFYARLYQCVEALATGNYAAYEDATPGSSNNETHPRGVERADETSIPDGEEPPDSSLTAAPGATEGNPDLSQSDAADSESPPPPPPPAATTTAAETDQVAQDAAKAAQDAETAAQEAQSSGNEPAAQAAQAAADAAKKAADSTRGQAALVAQKALLSGDGAAAAETLSQCLSSPRYGISRNDSNVTTVFLYWDGNIYYAINLTAPYVQVFAETSQLPRPPQLDPNSGGGDMIDWSIAFAVFAMFVCGLLCLIQKVLGRKVQVIRPLYRFQRWFFDPVHYRLDEEAMDFSERLDRGRGNTYTFSEDVIPLSMGGRMGWGVASYLAGLHKNLDNDRDAGGGDGDDDDESLSEEVELVAPKARPASWSSGDREGFHFSAGASEVATSPLHFSRANSPAQRFLRNPDFVALPHLKSTSKVAVPVSLHSSHHSRSSLDEHDDEKL